LVSFRKHASTNKSDSIMKFLSFRRRPWLTFLSNVLPLFFLKSMVNGADLKNAWDIIGPNGKKCLPEGDVGSLLTGSAINSTICDDSSSAIRLNYTIHKNAKYAKYKIFQKECQEEFEVGTEPIQGIMPPDEDSKIALSLSPSTDGYDTIAASFEIRPTKDYLSSPWWRRLSNTEKQQLTIEFCVRMGLWLPPEAGQIEVNFRETNVVVSFNKESSGEGDGYIVNSVELNAKELVGIKINLMGSTGAAIVKDEKDPAEGSSGGKNDEL